MKYRIASLRKIAYPVSVMKYACIFTVLLLCACTKGQGISLAPYQDKTATPYDFSLCHGFGCLQRTDVQLTLKDWRNIRRVFKPGAKTAEDERQKIAKAIARMESIATSAAGLPPDQGEAQTFKNHLGQMDCIDETVNTTLYLEFLQKENLLQFHVPAEPVHRGFFIDGRWPHNSAAIVETKTGALYVVDSYYFDSGERVAIIPFTTWHAGWRPGVAPIQTPAKPSRKPN